MGKWKQVGGDMSWDRHGVVLAKNEPSHGQVELVRIDPWIEHDREAAVTHGLYLVDRKTVDHSDLNLDGSNVAAAVASVGMDPTKYADLAPEHRAEILASYEGYDESESVDRLADGLPAPADEIEFWGGRETAEKLDGYDDEMRREALEANFETRLTFGELPAAEALEFALGGEPFEMELKGSDALAFEYAMAAAGVPGSTDTPDELAAVARALVTAPEPHELVGEVAEALAGILEDWTRRHGDPSDEEDGVAATARSLASSIMGSIGFEWI
jgi:hypothetical protein